MTVIPAEALTAIEAVIVNDEGGWLLTSNANDPDGGWTYAGVTHKTFVEYGYDVSVDVMKENIADPVSLAGLKQVVHQIYYEKYYRPLADHVHKPLDYELSCCINCGVATAIECADFSNGIIYRDKFLHAWLLHYAQLVRNNAEAWRTYASALASAVHSGEQMSPTMEAMKPKLLRAETLAGWINRVEKYR
jgi:hypothetical protein